MRTYSLRSLLILILLVALVLAHVTGRARAQKRGRAWVAEQGGHVTYSYSFDAEAGTYDHSAKLWAPAWMIDWIGIDYFATVDSVILDNQEVTDLEPIADLRSLRMFAIIIEIDDELDFSPLQQLPELEFVYLDYTDISTERLQQLRESLPGVVVDATNQPRLTN